MPTGCHSIEMRPNLGLAGYRCKSPGRSGCHLKIILKSAHSRHPKLTNIVRPETLRGRRHGLIYSTLQDAIVAKFSPTGSLLYATFIGGSATNVGGGIAVDSSGSAYIAGDSDSVDLPVTARAYQGPPASGLSVFVVKLNAQGSALVYSTFLGPGSGAAVRLDSQGNAYASGISDPGFPTTPGAFQSSLSSSWNTLNGLLPFIVKLNSTGTGLIYSVVFAGADTFDVDAAGNAYLAGIAGPQLPVTQGALQRCVAGAETNMFSAQLAPTGQLVAATYFGGTSYDYPTGIAAGSNGSVYLVESVTSTDLPGLQNVGVQNVTLPASDFYISDLSKTDLPCLTQAVQNGASFENTPIAPGELVTLLGLDLGPATGASMETDSAGGVSNDLDVPRSSLMECRLRCSMCNRSRLTFRSHGSLQAPVPFRFRWSIRAD
jgi:hypothetical protein